MPSNAQTETQRLLDVMAALRDPEHGCPWDRRQSFATIAPYTIEEAYEVADAIARQDWRALPDELGDLLFQVVYHARLAEEAGRFAFSDVAAAIADKMLRRHPHVFAQAVSTPGPHPATGPETHRVATPPPDRIEDAWDAAKAAERALAAGSGTDVPAHGTSGPPATILADIPAALPALSRAAKITRRVAAVGFDWPDAATVLDKLAEETRELEAEMPLADPARLADELGDMLFVMANLARKLGLDPETCLRQANDKFTRRFNAVELRLAEAGSTPVDASLAEMEAAWQHVKQRERRDRHQPGPTHAANPQAPDAEQVPDAEPGRS